MNKAGSSGSSTGTHSNFLEADGSLFRNSLLLDANTLKKVGIEGLNDASSFPPSTEAVIGIGDILTPDQARDSKMVRFIVPEPGKCFKTKDILSSQKVFINICHSGNVPEPPFYFTEDELRKVLRDGADSELEDVRIPMSIGAKRVDKDKMVKLPKASDQMIKFGVAIDGIDCQTYDVIINTEFYKTRILTSHLYWTFLCVISMEALQEKYNLELEKNDFVVMKYKACHGKLEPQFVREKAGIQELRSESTSKSSLPQKSNPIIQEI